MTRMDLDLREEAKFDLERRRARTEASEGEQPGQDDGCGGEGSSVSPSHPQDMWSQNASLRPEGQSWALAYWSEISATMGMHHCEPNRAGEVRRGVCVGACGATQAPREEVPSALTKGRGGLDLYLGHLMTPTKPNRPRHKPSWTPHIRSGAKGAAGRVCVCGGGRGERRTNHLHLAGKVS